MYPVIIDVRSKNKKDKDGKTVISPITGKAEKETVSEYLDIRDASDATLRRLIKEMDNYYYLVNDEEDKTYILNQKKMLEVELLNRK